VVLVGKQVADLITTARALLAFWLPWLGFNQGESSLEMAVWFLILNWTGDALDGTLARRSSRQYHTWIGDHDLEVDILVSFGLLLYMLSAGFVDLLLLGLYILVCALIFWRWGFHRSLGMLVQAPIYIWFIWVALQNVTTTGVWLIVWILAAMIITWPRFPNEVVPGFLTGMKEVVNLRRNKP
jgi:phosphatidylserine synthase